MAVGRGTFSAGIAPFGYITGYDSMPFLANLKPCYAALSAPLLETAAQRGLSIPQIALNWDMRKSGVDMHGEK
jgi:aryl-alcohol dehydrogenase-like predicted oxidoreductase